MYNKTRVTVFYILAVQPALSSDNFVKHFATLAAVSQFVIIFLQ